jgi:hypothetical protein
MWDFALPEYSLPQEFPSGTVRRESAPQNRPHAARWREAQMTESWWSMRKTMDEKDNCGAARFARHPEQACFAPRRIRASRAKWRALCAMTVAGSASLLGNG